MYAQHVPIISSAMHASPSVFARGVLFALLSIRVQFPRVPDMLRDVSKRGENASALWGFKLGAWQYVQAHGDKLWAQAREQDTAAALWTVTRVPGLGIVKGAFVLQLMGHDTACFDSRNLRREGVSPRKWRSNGDGQGKNNEAFRARIAEYVAFTKGRAEELWDVWCVEAAGDYLSSPEAISAMHLEIIRQPQGVNL